ncbi:MAG: thioesterase family protein [Nocardioidaceae bacterium]
MVYESSRAGGWAAGAGEVPAPLRLYDVAVPAEWVDYNEHMSEWCYLLVMGNNSDAFFRYLGIDEEYRAAGASLFTVETHIRNLDEASRGDRLHLALRVLAHDEKRVHVTHEVSRIDGGVIATGEQMLLHVDTRRDRVAPIPAVLRQRLSQIVASHSALPCPDWVGRVMGIPGHTGRRVETG